MSRTRVVFFSLFISIVVLVSCSFLLAEESISITTYYPSPYGVYNEMRLYPHSTPITSCDSTTEGTMFYNLTAHELQVCNGLGVWKSGGGFWAGSGNDIYNTNTGIVEVKGNFIFNGTNEEHAIIIPNNDITVGGAADASFGIRQINQSGKSNKISFGNQCSDGGCAVGTAWTMAIDTEHNRVGIGKYSGSALLSAVKNPETMFQVHNGVNTVLAATATGNVGIGTTTPRASLDVVGDDGIIVDGEGSSSEIRFRDAGTDGIYNTGDDYYFRLNTTGEHDRLKISATVTDDGLTPGFAGITTFKRNGYVGIGTQSPRAALDVVGDEVLIEDGSPEINFIDSDAGDINWRIGGGTGGYFHICPTPEADWDNTMPAPGNIGLMMRYDSVNLRSNVGLGVGNPTYQLHLSQNSAAKPTSNVWTVPSDIRIKKDIQPFTDGLGVIEKINPVSYKLNGKAGLPLNEAGIGVVAQDVKDVMPYTIKTWKAKLEPADSEETELYDFDSNALTYVLVNAVKDLKKQVEDLKAQINELKRK